MPVTRSSTKGSRHIVNHAANVTSTPPDKKTLQVQEGLITPSTTRKRKADTTIATNAKKTLKQDTAVPTNAPGIPETEEAALVPAVLTFDFEEAKNHLIRVDHRFEDLFKRMKCKPYEHLEQVHPFRALVTSILGQQISWLAARSINHRFIRLFDPSLPEKPNEEQRRAITSFPTPQQVATADATTLRTAGLSARKVEYIQDLAARFSDGRLSTQKLLMANDEELASMLIEVRGIGRRLSHISITAAVDMFAMFSLRRPDILPVGDLGVQRGLVRWFLSLHSPAHSFSISPEKGGGSASKKGKKKAVVEDQKHQLQVVNELEEDKSYDIGSSSVPPVALAGSENLAFLPPTFTPSIKKTLNKPATSPGIERPPLPSGIDVALLKRRLEAKKKIKGAFLTPQEMADLTEHWKPYRSLGVYYMWSLADAE
ncbi:DNA glycosylase [Crassisporium funariophilum]|nr:DNA glycosylase [Crassisporium funariophilum]